MIQIPSYTALHQYQPLLYTNAPIQASASTTNWRSDQQQQLDTGSSFTASSSFQKLEEQDVLFPKETVEWEKPIKRKFLFKGPLCTKKNFGNDLFLHQLKFKMQKELLQKVEWRNKELMSINEAKLKWKPFMDVAIHDACKVGKHLKKYHKKELKEHSKDAWRMKMKVVVQEAAEVGALHFKDPFRDSKWSLEKQIDMILDCIKFNEGMSEQELQLGSTAASKQLGYGTFAGSMWNQQQQLQQQQVLLPRSSLVQQSAANASVSLQQPMLVQSSQMPVIRQEQGYLPSTVSSSTNIPLASDTLLPKSSTFVIQTTTSTGPLLNAATNSNIAATTATTL